jgi:hypothetical protein
VRVLSLQEIGHNQAEHLIANMLEPLNCLIMWWEKADRQWRDVWGRGRHRGNGTELFVIWARVLRGVLKYVRRAGGKATVGEDARLDLRRVDPWEIWETTWSKVRPGWEGGRWEERRADDERNVNARLRGGEETHGRT